MPTATMQVTTLRRSAARPGRDLRPQRPNRGSARSVQPITRPLAGVPAPEVRTRRLHDATTRSCGVARPYAGAVAPARARSGWRLTDRGIAVVLVVGAVLLAAAVTVIAATAVTVTSDTYHRAGFVIAQR